MRDSQLTARGPASTVSTAGAEAYAAVTALLYQERDVLEELLFRLVEQQLVLANGSTRWLPKVDADVRAATQHVQEYEIARAIEVEMLVQQYGLPADVTLRGLAERAPEPWPMVLTDHREALLALTAEIDSVAAENRRMLIAGEQATREAILQATGAAPEPPPGQRRSSTFGAGNGLRGRSFMLDQRA